MYRKILFAAVWIVLALAGCSPVSGPATPTEAGSPPAGEDPGPGGDPLLAGTSWTLVSFGLAGEESLETPVIPGAEPTLIFEADGQAGGSGGCNSFGTGYTVNGDQISFEPIITTEMACLEEGIMEQEQKYYGALGSAVMFEMSDGMLRIWYDDGAATLNFVASDPS